MTTFTIQVNGRTLEITVTDLTCDYPGCTNQRRTRRAHYCAEHDTSAARMATQRRRRKLVRPPMVPTA